MGIDNNWAYDMPTRLYSIINDEIIKNKPYSIKNINVTMDSSNLNNPEFPTIYIEFNNINERDLDLEAIKINSILLNMQIEIITPKKNDKYSKVLSQLVISILKNLQFEILSFPALTENTDIKRLVMRARRIFSFNDII